MVFLPIICTFSMHRGRTQMESFCRALYFEYKVFGIYIKRYHFTNRNIAREKSQLYQSRISIEISVSIELRSTFYLLCPGKLPKTPMLTLPLAVDKLKLVFSLHATKYNTLSTFSEEEYLKCLSNVS